MNFRVIFFTKICMEKLIFNTFNIFIIGMYCLISTGCRRQQINEGSLAVKTVAFVNKSGNVNHIWLMDINSSGVGTNARRLTNDAEGENYPTWSTDGNFIVYQREY